MKSFVFIVLVSSLFLTEKSQATIFLDFEAEPLPLVDISVTLPVGYEARSVDEVGAANVLPDILDSGTPKLDRQAFLEKIAEFGANYDFSVTSLHSQWSLSFPLVAGKGVDSLIQVLSENWATPRFDAKTFDLAKLKLESGIRGSVDSDNALAMTSIQRSFKKYEARALPAFIEDIDALKMSATQKVFERDFHGVKDIWAGVVGPASSLELVKKILATVFSKQGDVVVGEHLEKFKLFEPDTSGIKVAKHALIIDKPGRAQTVTSAMSFYPGHLEAKQELPFFFGDHVFFESGLGSIWAAEIRTKRGLAYSVQSTGQSYLGLPTIGLLMNPIRAKADEALKVSADLFKSGFEKSELLKGLSQEEWDRNWKSFKFKRILASSTPSGRLGEREAVVLGEMSAEFYKSDPRDWKASPAEVEKVFNGFWNGGATYLAVVGEASELKPIIAKYFPGYAVKVIPYKDVISRKAYQ